MSESLSRFHEALSRVEPRSVAMGYREVRLFAPEELESAQLGYSCGPNGEDLTGRERGDWRPFWLVFASEDELGDPIFVNLGRSPWPVFTAMHGDGSWTPVMLADSFETFTRAFAAAGALSDRRLEPGRARGNRRTATNSRNSTAVLDEFPAKADADWWLGWAGA